MLVGSFVVCICRNAHIAATEYHGCCGSPAWLNLSKNVVLFWVSLGSDFKQLQGVTHLWQFRDLDGGVSLRCVEAQASGHPHRPEER